MTRGFWAALVAVAGLACASQAGAAIVTANWSGYFDYGQAQGGPYYSLSVTFDTALGTLGQTTLAGGGHIEGLHWSAADAGPSPLLSATLVISGPVEPSGFPTTLVQGAYSFGGLTNFGVSHDLQGIAVTINDANRSISLRNFDTSPIDLSSDFLLTTPYSWSFFGASMGTGSVNIPGSAVSSDMVVRAASLSVVGPSGPVPEPGAWAMLILGFLGIGIAVRRQRIRLGSSQGA